MESPDPYVAVRHLSVRLPDDRQDKVLVRDVNFDIERGEMVGLVGESGSGKSISARAMLRLLPPRAVVDGSVEIGSERVLELGKRDLRKLRQYRVAMIFQDPRAFINPVRKVGAFMLEGLQERPGYDAVSARRDALARLEEVGLDSPEKRFNQYPYELSGGMLQRVLIAAALLVQPALIIADEPTTALDVTTQSEIMALIEDARKEYDLSVLFITHDLDLAIATCDRIAVIYAGRTVEEQRASLIAEAPLHPYTYGLLSARPRLASHNERLPTIPGRPIAAFESAGGCPFAPRCAFAQPECTAWEPRLDDFRGGSVACRRRDEISPLGQGG